MSDITKLLQILLVMVGLLQPQLAYSQDNDQRFYVEEVTVKPSNMNEYHQSISKVMAMMDEHHYRFATNVVTTDDGRFLWFTPVVNFGTMDEVLLQRQAIFKQLSAEQSQVISAMNDATATSRSYFINLSSSLSYFSPEQNKSYDFIEVNTFNFQPGSEILAEQLFLKIRGLHLKLDIPQDYHVYKSSIGMLGSQIIVVQFAKDAVHLAQKVKAQEHKFKRSDGAKSLRKQFSEILTSYESVTGKRYRKFSYTPIKSVAKL